MSAGAPAFCKDKAMVWVLGVAVGALYQAQAAIKKYEGQLNEVKNNVADAWEDTKDAASNVWAESKTWANDTWEKTKDAAEDVKAEIKKATN